VGFLFPFFMTNFNIEKVNTHLSAEIQHKIDLKTKPTGALGVLEKVALQIANIQQNLSPTLINPHLLVFAADHGLAREGVSKYPPEVTFQMVLNFVNGGAAINVFSKQNGLTLQVIDAGVLGDFSPTLPIIHQKVAHGTQSSLHNWAMTTQEATKCIDLGAKVVQDIVEKTACNIIGFGEMGIGNTSAASLLMNKICKIPLVDCVGRGTGVDDEGLKHKISILEQVVIKHQTVENPLEILASVGGLEIAQMVGAMLQAAQNQMIVLVDGFIATSALLVAYSLEPAVLDYTIFCHQSDESGHRLMLEYLKAEPLLKLNLRLGEGTGCALAYPLVQAAVNFLNEMASFESAGVSDV
jgi:nicotinate-nucleotide--dimethylbenzimidazole phosphoribosyltransferase